MGTSGDCWWLLDERIEELEKALLKLASKTTDHKALLKIRKEVSDLHHGFDCLEYKVKLLNDMQEQLTATTEKVDYNCRAALVMSGVLAASVIVHLFLRVFVN